MKLIVPIERLPDTPSQLIRAALLDVKDCSRDPRYQVEHPSFWEHAWHRLNRKGKCVVCMAGAVIAKSLYVEWGREVTPEHFEPDTKKKLMALNEFRQGGIHTALVHILEHRNNPLEVERKITPYAESPRLFFRQMHMLADDLAAAGL